jgi:hypothetical protein
VLIDDPRPAGSTGMTQAILALRYDPSVFTVSASDVSLGSVPLSSKGWKLEAIVDQATGQIGVVIYAASGVPIRSSTAGSLVTVKLHAKSGAVNGTSPINLAAEVTLPGRGVVRTQIDDDQGAYVLTPAPSDAADDLTDGSVIVSGGVSLAPQVVAFGIGAAPTTAGTRATASAVLEVIFRLPVTRNNLQTAPEVPVVAGKAPSLWSDPAVAGGGLPSADVAKLLTKPAPTDLSAIEQALAQEADRGAPIVAPQSRSTRRTGH